MLNKPKEYIGKCEKDNNIDFDIEDNIDFDIEDNIDFDIEKEMNNDFNKLYKKMEDNFMEINMVLKDKIDICNHIYYDSNSCKLVCKVCKLFG